jgi:hypothetical protein
MRGKKCKVRIEDLKMGLRLYDAFAYRDRTEANEIDDTPTTDHRRTQTKPRRFARLAPR